VPISTIQNTQPLSFIGIATKALVASMLSGIGVDSKAITNRAGLAVLNKQLALDMPECIAYSPTEKKALEDIRTQIQPIEVNQTLVDCVLDIDRGSRSLITLQGDPQAGPVDKRHIVFTPKSENLDGSESKIQQTVLDSLAHLPGCGNLFNATDIDKDIKVLSQLNQTDAIITRSGEAAFDAQARPCALSMLQQAKSEHLSQIGLANCIAALIVSISALYIIQLCATSSNNCEPCTEVDTPRDPYADVQQIPVYKPQAALMIAAIIALKNSVQAPLAAVVGSAVANAICTVEGMRGSPETTGYSEKNMLLGSMLGSSLMSVLPALRLARQLTLPTLDNNTRLRYENNWAAHSANMMMYSLNHALSTILGQAILESDTFDAQAAQRATIVSAIGLVIVGLATEVAALYAVFDKTLPEPQPQAAQVSQPQSHTATSRAPADLSERDFSEIDFETQSSPSVTVPMPSSPATSSAGPSQSSRAIEMMPFPAHISPRQPQPRIYEHPSPFSNEIKVLNNEPPQAAGLG